ncbi:MAG: Ycf66 family protein [Xenococcaceae cyanobacterium]
MLAHILAIAVGLSSLVLFLTAFSMSEIHRKDDFLWSGVGLFYALVLWFGASRITGSLLLGQIAVVSLVISLNWQNLQLRKAVANPDEAANINLFSITELISGFFQGSDRSDSQPNIAKVLDTETPVEDSSSATENVASPSTPETISAEEVSTVTENIKTEDSLSTPEVIDADTTTESDRTEDFLSTAEVSQTQPTPEVIDADTTTESNRVEDSFSTAEVSQTQPTPEVIDADTTTESNRAEDFLSTAEVSQTQPTTEDIEATSSFDTEEAEDSLPTAEVSQTQINKDESTTIGESSNITENADLEDSIEPTTSDSPITETYNVEDKVESNEVESFASTQFSNPETIEDILSSQEPTEIEEQERTTSESDSLSSFEEVDTEEQKDPNDTLSDTKNRPKSSLDDFLAELENSMNKKSNEDN